MAKKAKILICDDEKGVRESLDFILRQNYELSFANNESKALEHIKDHSADLMLLDIKMPGIDWYCLPRHQNRRLRLHLQTSRQRAYP